MPSGGLILNQKTMLAFFTRSCMKRNDFVLSAALKTHHEKGKCYFFLLLKITTFWDIGKFVMPTNH